MRLSSISCNDSWTDKERQLLKPYLRRAIGTKDGKDVERAKVFAMHACTRITPYATELVGLKEYAEKIREAKTLEEAEYAVAAARSAEYAARSADIRKLIIQACLNCLDDVLKVSGN